MNLLRKFRITLDRLVEDARGIALSSELVFMAVVAFVGLIVASTSVRDSIISELSDVAGAAQDLKQEYLVDGIEAHSSSVAGMDFIDSTDHCDDAEDQSGQADNCITFNVPPTDEVTAISDEEQVVKLNFDDGTASDTSAQGQDNSGIPQGDPEFINGEVIFDGDDSIQIANSGDINIGTHGTRTIAFDFNADDVTNRQVLYEEGATARGLVIYIDNGFLYIGGWNIPAGESGWQPTFMSIPITAGTDYNVALTLNGDGTVQPGALSGFLNGTQFGSVAGSQLWSHGGGIGIGGTNGSTIFHDGGSRDPAFFSGSIDNFCMYDRVLTSDEISTLGN